MWPPPWNRAGTLSPTWSSVPPFPRTPPLAPSPESPATPCPGKGSKSHSRRSPGPRRGQTGATPKTHRGPNWRIVPLSPPPVPRSLLTAHCSLTRDSPASSSSLASKTPGRPTTNFPWTRLIEAMTSATDPAHLIILPSIILPSSPPPKPNSTGAAGPLWQPPTTGACPPAAPATTPSVPLPCDTTPALRLCLEPPPTLMPHILGASR